ncbi:MAG TPA: SpoVR family protein [Rubrivivax sp.]|nr:SpoVR family protein [Rubrivivax sp.]
MKAQPLALEQPLPLAQRPGEPLPAPSDWSFELIESYHRVIRDTAARFGLDTYPNQLEIITAEQMMDAYASVGMPVNYRHWSYGKEFIATEKNYKRGHMGLAYEIVINANPCISYLMEENTLAMQALVIAHAAYGHNSFFKGNYLFRMWTDASSIIDYLVYAKDYVARCEEQHGLDAVETFLDSCHALANHGVDRYRRPSRKSLAQELAERRDREAYAQQQVNDLWRTLPRRAEKEGNTPEAKRFPDEPQENLLYFIEKNAPLLEPWQREIVRIVRKVAQYFYPQRQTQVMNEGWACVTGDTLIVTDQGLMPAQELVDTQFNGSVEDGNRVVNWFTHPRKPRVRLTTRHGYVLHGGSDHKILVGDRWVELRSLRVGDRVEIRRGKGVFARDEAVIDYDTVSRPRLAEVCARQGVSMHTFLKWQSHHRQLRVSAEHAQRLQACLLEWQAIKADSSRPLTLQSADDLPRRPTTLNADLAEVLGQLIGDGFVETSHSGRINLTSQDAPLLDFFEHTMAVQFGLQAKRRPDRRHFNSTVHSAALARVLAGSFEFAQGFGAAGRKTVPPIVLRSPAPVVCAFLRGHFDTDGCVSQADRQVILVSKSLELLRTEQQLLLNLGIVCSVRPQRDGTHRLVITGSDLALYAQAIGFRLPAKQQALQAVLDRTQRFLRKEDMTTIERLDVDEGPVVDFSVENSHAYKASCFINHNCFWHHKLLNTMYGDGFLTDGVMLEWLTSHTNVIYQPPVGHRAYSGLNPYALGFAMYTDIQRICEAPSDEDRQWFPGIAGKPWLPTLDHAMRNFKDESFIGQYLSPQLMREMRLFAITDDEKRDALEVSAIHDDSGYRRVREALSQQYDLGSREPNIQVWNVNLRGDRSLTLRHFQHNNRPLHDSGQEVLKHVARLWGFGVQLESVNSQGDVTRRWSVPAPPQS